MKKVYKRKHKREKRKKLIILISVFVLLTSGGYSLFSEVLSINGSASSRKYLIRDDKLRVTLSGPNYATGTWDSIYLVDEVYDGVNRLTSTFQLTDFSKTRHTEDIFIYVTNPYGAPMKNGSQSFNIDYGNFIRVVPRRESAKIEMDQQEYWRVRLKFRGDRVGDGQVTTTFTYTTDGVTQDFIWVIRLLS